MKDNEQNHKFVNNSSIACVTGATGMIGRKIVQGLLQQGYAVRVLSRKVWLDMDGVLLFTGGLENEETLRLFLE